MKKMKDETKMVIILAVFGSALLAYNFFTINSGLLSLISVGIVVAGPGLFEYRKYNENKEIEERFPDFLRDVTENIRTGMTVTQAFKATKDNRYGALTPYIRK